MPVLRSDITAAQLPKLYDAIDRRLELIGIETPPEVAARLTELSMDQSAGPNDFAQVMQHDPAISGRLLRLANSAYFAQRAPVTRVDRAAVLLGVDRLRTVALGFFTPARPADDPETTLIRELWTGCLYRGTLAMELARDLAPGAMSEAFIAGMLLDIGESSMGKLLGSRYLDVHQAHTQTGRRFEVEHGTLPFTHVDVAAALCRRWQIPDVIAKPVRWHHTKPKDVERTETMHQLHRIAYLVGGIDTSAIQSRSELKLPARLVEHTLAMDPKTAAAAARRAHTSFAKTLEQYTNLLADISDVAGMMERARRKLVEELDTKLIESVSGPAPDNAPARFVVGDSDIEIERGETGIGIAYMLNGEGERIASHRFRSGEQARATILAGLFIEPSPGDDLEALDAYLAGMAA